MEFKLTLMFVVAVAMAVTALCPDDAKQTDAQDLLVKANDQFTAKMFAEVIKEKSGENVVMSAFSVLTPLGQLEIATDGDAHAELVNAIGIPESAVDDVFTYMNCKLKSVDKVELKSASRIYIPIGSELNDSFAAVSRDVFQSVPQNIDFSKTKEAAETMNKWVEEQTNHRIKDLIQESSLGSDTKVVLVNALYFKGSWIYPFHEELTAPREFHVSKTKSIQLPTMERESTFEYGESSDLDAKLVALPYEDGRTSMLIILPNDIDGLEALEEKLKDPAVLNKALSEMSRAYEVTVRLPKFKIETEIDLKEVLSGIDVKKIFSKDARIVNLVKGESDIFISQAKQKAFIEVNEFGTEAAAANEFFGVGASPIIPPHRNFYADHPFMFIINIESVYKRLTLFSGVYRQ